MKICMKTTFIDISILGILASRSLHRIPLYILRKALSHDRTLGYAACSEGLKNQRSLFPQGGKVKVSFSHFIHKTSELTAYPPRTLYLYYVVHISSLLESEGNHIVYISFSKNNFPFFFHASFSKTKRSEGWK